MVACLWSPPYSASPQLAAPFCWPLPLPKPGFSLDFPVNLSVIHQVILFPASQSLCRGYSHCTPPFHLCLLPPLSPFFLFFLLLCILPSFLPFQAISHLFSCPFPSVLPHTATRASGTGLSANESQGYGVEGSTGNWSAGGSGAVKGSQILQEITKGVSQLPPAEGVCQPTQSERR